MYRIIQPNLRSNFVKHVHTNHVNAIEEETYGRHYGTLGLRRKRKTKKMCSSRERKKQRLELIYTHIDEEIHNGFLGGERHRLGQTRQLYNFHIINHISILHFQILLLIA